VSRVTSGDAPGTGRGLVLRASGHRPVAAWIAALALAGSLLAPAGAAASASQVTLFEAPAELLGDASRAAALDQIRQLGAGAIRVVMYWHDVAPAADAATRPSFDATDPAAYGDAWGPFDRLVAEAAARGLRVMLTVSGPVPRWATAARRDTVTRPRPAEFRSFMTAVGRRYGGSVAWWSIWNEPNHPRYLAPQSSHGRPVSPRLYRALFLAGRAGLEASGRLAGAPVLMGETAPRASPQDIAPLTFLRGALCLSPSYRRSRRCGRLPADGYAHHPYTTRAGPFFVPPRRDDVTIGVVARLVRALDRAARAGAVRARLPVYLTEFGVQSYPDRLIGVSPARQSDYRSIAELMAYRVPRVVAFSQYLLRDDAPRLGASALLRYGGFESGLVFAAGGRKPAYDGFRLPLVVRARGRRASLWGLVRPAGGAGTTVAVLVAAPRSSSFRRLRVARTDARGYWSARAALRPGQRFRVSWTAPDGSTVLGPPTSAYRF